MIILLLLPLFIIAVVMKLMGRQSPKSIDKKHVVITGGSSGIGKSTAILAAKKGAKITIIARNAERLSAAKNEIQEACIYEDQKVISISVDVSDKAAIQNELDKIEETQGPIYMLVNCAGVAICGKVEDLTEQDVKTLINTNYLGTLYPIQCVVPKLKKCKDGIIVLTASQVALMGMYGYSIYSSCKFALRGLAESISMELKPYNISVTLALPPDTDTPGYEAENKTKPKETQLISQTGGLMRPETVAKQLLQDALGGHFFSFVGFESYLLTTLCVGMAPFTSFLELLVQAVVLGPFRLIGAYYLSTFHNIVQNCYLTNQADK